MSYVPDPTVLTEPTDNEPASTAAAEFRALKAYIANTLLAGLSGNVKISGVQNIGGEYHITYPRALYLESGVGNVITGRSADGATTHGTLGLGPGSVGISAVGGVVNLDVNSVGTLQYTGTVFFPTNGTSDLGTPAKKFNNLYAIGAAFSSTVTANQFIGDGSRLTGLAVSSGAPTSSQIISALGYTPYSNSNPSGFIAGISAANIIAALGYTPYNASSNPNGYISGISSPQITSALGFTPVAPGQNLTATNASGIAVVQIVRTNPAYQATLNFSNGFNSFSWQLYMQGGATDAFRIYSSRRGGDCMVIDDASGVVSFPYGISGVGSNAAGNRTVSTAAPSGGSDGDIWYQVAG